MRRPSTRAMSWITSRLRASEAARDCSESGVFFAIVSLTTLGFLHLFFSPLPCTVNLSPLIKSLVFLISWRSLRGECRREAWELYAKQVNLASFSKNRKKRNKLRWNYKHQVVMISLIVLGHSPAPTLRSPSSSSSPFLSPISPSPSPSQPLSHTNFLCLCTSPSPSSISPPLSLAPTRNRLRLQGDQKADGQR